MLLSSKILVGYYVKKSFFFLFFCQVSGGYYTSLHMNTALQDSACSVMAVKAVAHSYGLCGRHTHSDTKSHGIRMLITAVRSTRVHSADSFHLCNRAAPVTDLTLNVPRRDCLKDTGSRKRAISYI